MNNIAHSYVRKYGEPSRQAEFVSPERRRIEVYKWDSAQADEGVAMYATVGASEILGDALNSCEFFIGLLPQADEIAKALAEVALHGTGNGLVPSAGDSVTLSYSLLERSPIRSFLFTDGSGILPAVMCGSKRIEFIQLVPLFESELVFKKQYGEKALWDKFEELEIPYWDSTRVPAQFAASDQSGAVLWRKTYAPFGEQTDTQPEDHRSQEGAKK